MERLTPERAGLRRTTVFMNTLVSIEIVGHDAGDGGWSPADDRSAAIERAFEWFAAVETCCSRFDEASEVGRLRGLAGVPMPVSAMLFEVVQFAVALAEESGGAFDPTVGHVMAARGFDRNFRTGDLVAAPAGAGEPVSYRDVTLDRDARTILLRRPLMLDLGAVAKGFAIDLAARELAPFQNFAIDAGGDLYLGGHGPHGQPWSVGIRHPRERGRLMEALTVSDRAVCTSGDYERCSPRDAGGHILDPRVGEPAARAASVTVIAPRAMLADGLATAAFVLGPVEGLRLLDRHGVSGLVVAETAATLERHVTGADFR